jgi:hypothetical protein
LERRTILLISVVVGALLGCATKGPPQAVVPSRAPARAASARLAVLPSDPLLFADIATALDERLGRVRLDGAGPMVKAKVSMEVAQLSLECVSATDDCYTQVGKYLQVDRLLWGQIARDSQTAGVTVTVVLLDVDRGASVARAQQTFAQSQAAIEGLATLVDKATAKAPPPRPPRPATVSQRERAP